MEVPLLAVVGGESRVVVFSREIMCPMLRFCAEFPDLYVSLIFQQEFVAWGVATYGQICLGEFRIGCREHALL